jgi:hypothetical protein
VVTYTRKEPKMAQFSFSSFNQERLFDLDTTDFEYVKLKDLFEANGAENVYQLLAVYIGTKSEFDDESPIAAIDGSYVNLPQFQLPEVKAMLANKVAIAAIKRGDAGFRIEKYIKKLKSGNRTCYKAVWCDYTHDID